VGALTAGHIFRGSDRIGSAFKKARGLFARPEPEPQAAPFTIL
jgi:hypothetical protein